MVKSRIKKQNFFRWIIRVLKFECWINWMALKVSKMQLRHATMLFSVGGSIFGIIHQLLGINIWSICFYWKMIDTGLTIECEGWRQHFSLIFLILLFAKPNIEVVAGYFRPKHTSLILFINLLQSVASILHTLWVWHNNNFHFKRFHCPLWSYYGFYPEWENHRPAECSTTERNKFVKLSSCLSQLSACSGLVCPNGVILWLVRL